MARKKLDNIMVETDIEGKEATSIADKFEGTTLSDDAIVREVQKHIDEWASEHNFDDVYVSNITVHSDDDARKKALQVKLKDLLS